MYGLHKGNIFSTYEYYEKVKDMIGTAYQNGLQLKRLKNQGHVVTSVKIDY